MYKLVTWLQDEYPELVQEMKDSTHHYGRSYLNPYHLEGDVWSHVMMVAKQAENQNQLVKIAALLHDIGKPVCRTVKHENQRTRFFNHESMSAFMAIELMKDLKLVDCEKTMVFNLIALHTEFYKHDTDFLKKLLNRQPTLAANLYELAKADSNGRFCNEADQAYTKAIVKLTPHNHERSEMETPKLVTIMCGVPGSGKSTYIENNLADSFVVSRDDCLMSLEPELSYSEAWSKVDQKEVDKLVQKQFKEAKQHDNVVVDMTHMSKKSRRRSLSHFGKEYRKECVLILQSLPDVYLTNKERCGKIIEKEVVDRMVKSFYPPMLDEFDDIKYIWR